MINSTEQSILVAFDIDATLLEGPASVMSLIKQLIGRFPWISTGYLETLNQLASLEDDGSSRVSDAQQNTGFGVALSKARHKGRKPNPGVVKMLSEISGMTSPVVEMVVLSGRSASELYSLTVDELENHGINKFFSENGGGINLKPDGFSSVGWKMAYLKDVALRGYQAMALLENDVRTAIWVADMGRDLGLNIHVFLLESFETNFLVLKAIGLSREILADRGVGLIKSLDEFPDKLRSSVS